MAVQARQLSTGDYLVFDTDAKDLYLISSTIELDTADPVSHARDLVDAGDARHFDRATLEVLHIALANLVLLGASD